MGPPDASLYERLADARGNRVGFLSHCLLDENVRYLGGAFHSATVPDMGALIPSGVGICQIPCPELHAWGDVRKPMLLRADGLRDTRLYHFRRPLLRLFLCYTRLRHSILARSVVRDIERYRRRGMEVVGIVGVGASPSCGVTTTLDTKRSSEALAGCPLATIDRKLMNERAVAGCRIGGEELVGIRRPACKRRATRRSPTTRIASPLDDSPGRRVLARTKVDFKRELPRSLPARPIPDAGRRARNGVRDDRRSG